jgi:hypothetical protein
MSQFNFIDPKLANQFGKDYVKIMVSLLKNNTTPSRAGLRPYPKVATGNLVSSINYKLVDTANGIQIQLLSADYLKYVDQGRKPGTYPPIQAIKRWAAVKGIPVQAAWAIRQNIYKYGIKPTKVISKTMRIITTTRDANRKYEQAMVDNIVKYLEKNYNATVSKSVSV